MTATQQSNDTPLQVNGFQVYGTCSAPAPAARRMEQLGRPAAPRRRRPLATAPDGTVPIGVGLGADPRRLGRRPMTARPCRRAPPTPADGCRATVPGTVLASLVEEGHLPDPVEGFNNLHDPRGPVPALLVVPAALPPAAGLQPGPGRHIWLEFDGINHQR